MKKLIAVLLLTALLATLLSGCTVLAGLLFTAEPKQAEGGFAPPHEQTEAGAMSRDPIYEVISVEIDGGSYHVPQIECDSNDVRNINAEISTFVGDHAQREISNLENGLSASCFKIDYETVWYRDFMTLIVRSHYDGGTVAHRVYTLNREDGSLLTNEQIMSVCRILPEEFLTQAKLSAKNYFELNWPESLPTGTELYHQLLESTLSEENIHTHMTMFPGEDGGLMLISSIGSPAGAAECERLYPYLQY